MFGERQGFGVRWPDTALLVFIVDFGTGKN